jgi:hypothetical protein
MPRIVKLTFPTAVIRVHPWLTYELVEAPPGAEIARRPGWKTYMYIDTHTHLYHKQFDQDRKEMMRRAMNSGVHKLFLPNIDITSVEALHAMCDEYPESCFPMMGLHPCSVGEDPSRDLAEVERLLRTGRYWAVGEIGIDLYWDKTWLPSSRKPSANKCAGPRSSRCLW